jgi:lipid-binding SYLF domain-containing protein
MKTHTIVFAFTTLFLGAALSGASQAADPVTQAHQTMALFTKTDPGLRRFMEKSAGYAVFPSITKGAVGIGGAHGSGTVFDHTGKAVAKAKVTQVTIGAQIGGQNFSEVIFFENEKSFSDFMTGEFSMTAGVSAVALSKGNAENATYRSGVAVFTATNTGLMFEAAVGGQKFKVEPLQAK